LISLSTPTPSSAPYITILNRTEGQNVNTSQVRQWRWQAKSHRSQRGA
jgi:hypothetical protein